jgi:DNA polymerase/3'-5' exonuclease PolX
VYRTRPVRVCASTRTRGAAIHIFTGHQIRIFNIYILTTYTYDNLGLSVTPRVGPSTATSDG